MSVKNKLLVVDDEPDLCEILKFNLEHEGFSVDTAESAEKALELLQENSYQLILLDVMMGRISGYKMAEYLRKKLNNHTPIVFLTARDSENDLLTGFSVGGDDYIAKPFSLKEVIARIRAVIKRTEDRELQMLDDNLKFGNLYIDLNSKNVIIRGKAITFTKTEFEILHYLAKNAGRVFSRDNILQIVWPNNTFVLDRTVDVHITRLRRKLGEYGNYIKNRSGYGYCFDPE